MSGGMYACTVMNINWQRIAPITPEPAEFIGNV